jgi:hypothetical protein
VTNSAYPGTVVRSARSANRALSGPSAAPEPGAERVGAHRAPGRAPAPDFFRDLVRGSRRRLRIVGTEARTQRADEWRSRGRQPSMTGLPRRISPAPR